MSTLIAAIHNTLNGAVYAHGPLRDAARAVLEVHRPQRIYDDCGHRPHDCAEDGSVPPGLVELEGIGLVCESGYMYSICASCCTARDGFQSEMCASEHEHLDPTAPCCPCPTVVAVATALGVRS